MRENKPGFRMVERSLKAAGKGYAVTVLLLVVLYLARMPALGILAAIMALVLSLRVAVKVLLRRRVAKDYLLRHLLLIGGTALFFVVFGASGFFHNAMENLLLSLPALTFGLLLFNIEKLAKPRNRYLCSVLFTAALICFSLQYLITMNLKIRPQVGSLKEGHDDYLDSLGEAAADSPNVLLILMDDLGYGDISAYGNTMISTPNIDFLAENGVTMENFFSASPVCTPSRFAVLTGRYPQRGHLGDVLMPTARTLRPNVFRYWNPVVIGRGVDGILPDEITVAEALQASGYRTGIFGKWHLGDYGAYRPNEHGFDHFYGSYYSNDMFPYEFYRNEEKVIGDPLDQSRITRDLTDEIIDFISENEEEKFLIHYATPWPHDPIHASAEFKGSSLASVYGDCLQEFDAGLGEILEALREKDLFDNTLIIFTSDNGPWHEGATAGLRGRKGNSFAGGQQVPLIVCLPGELPAGTRLTAPAMNIDLMPTILARCGLDPPADRVIDGVDLWPVLQGEKSGLQRGPLFFTRGGKVFGALSGDFKYFDRVRCENSAYLHLTYRDFLFDVGRDPAESYNVRLLYPEKAAELKEIVADFRRGLKTNPRGRL